MRRFGSVVGLHMSLSLWRLLVITAAAVAAEMGFFLLALSGRPADALETVVETSAIPWVAAVGFLLLALWLPGAWLNHGGSQVDYTAMRLSLTQRQLVAIQGLWFALCFFLFWGLQAGAALLMWRIYQQNGGDFTGQEGFLAFTRGKFLHSLLPVADPLRGVRNVILALTLGCSAAMWTMFQRKGRRSYTYLVVAAGTVIFVPDYMISDGDVALICVSLLILVFAVHWIWRGAELDE